MNFTEPQTVFPLGIPDWSCHIVQIDLHKWQEVEGEDIISANVMVPGKIYNSED
ncbi:hypothetical protein Pint_09488 [Pistacia integerrima]|uniref:Uncharacterized protein n=1 Tax=Pistacia integerrima TaxID=434235 RepID=A0ACC0XG17_9ROSI|nr:hypothetical protein Pint_09488 [Pistacia integerrima]